MTRKQPKAIAIIGAGLAGLSAAWHLLNDTSITVTIFDASGIAAGASGMSTGLLHPFAGPHSKLNPEGWEGYSQTLELLKESERFVGCVYKSTGMYRPAITEIQLEKFAIAAKSNPKDITWLSSEEMLKAVCGVAPLPGIYIAAALTVYMRKYVQGLWLACQQKGAKLSLHSVKSLEELSSFDSIIVAAGAGYSDIPEVSSVKLSKIKGQQLALELPDALSQLITPINGPVTILASEKPRLCIVGSTFERNFTTSEVDQQKAEDELLPRLKELYAPFYSGTVVGVQAGMRISAPGRLPVALQINKNTWVFTGFGSKGLLYHALYGKRLANVVLS